MNVSKQQLVRIADNIRGQLQILKTHRHKKVQQRITELIGKIERLQSIRRKLGICETHGWNAAALKVMDGIERDLRDVPYHVEELERAVQEHNVQAPSLRDIYQDLIQADEEFGELRYYRESKLLAVTTEPIELDGIYLGDFEIQLHLPSLAEMRYNALCRIMALDPQPAASNEGVTHPHVSDEGLCPGDAGAAIRTALAGGRICDFFVLVRSVLTNYNPDSPYVSLDKWHGVPCYDCGYITGGDNVYWCSSCENDFCDECTSYCRKCDESTCLGCLENCSVCDELVCPACMTTCPECGVKLCQTCLEQEQCTCLEEDEENENDTNENET